MYSKLGWILAGVLVATVAEGRIISRDEALRTAFPGAEIQSTVVFLTGQEMKEAGAAAGTELPTALIARYRAVLKSVVVGWAYLDTHVVRTKKQSLLVILDADGKVRRVEIVAFLEPPEYIPPERWYEQFEGKELSEGLQLSRDIHPVTGATLTAHETTKAIRRVLAVDGILRKKESGKSQ